MSPARNLQFVPYRGTGPAMQDLVAGQIDMMISDPITAHAAGARRQIKIYARRRPTRGCRPRRTSRRSTRPDCRATTSRCGTGFWVPKGTPKPIIARLNAAVMDALADPATRAKLAEVGQEIFPREQQTPEALARPAKSRDREMVADHQGRQHQGGIGRFVADSQGGLP